MAKLQKPGAEREVEKRAAVDMPTKNGRTAPEEREREIKPRGGGGAGNGHTRSSSPLSAHRRQQPSGGQQHLLVLRLRWEHPLWCPASGAAAASSRRLRRDRPPRAPFGRCTPRGWRYRRSDPLLPPSMTLMLAATGEKAVVRSAGGTPMSGLRRSDSLTGSRRAPASPSAHWPASPMRKAAKEHDTPERASRPRVRDGGGEHPVALAG